jgi:ferredoxin
MCVSNSSRKSASPRWPKKTISGIANLLLKNGLIPRGALWLDPAEALSLKAKSLILIGHAGSSIWPHFTKWRQTQPPDLANPLDAWSEQVISPIAKALGGRAIFPFQKPFHPFQQWVMRAEGLKPSPLGILIHPVYGLWHAYRGAVVFDDEILIQEAQEKSHPCDLCLGKPCLSACPVNAFSGQGYDVQSCRTHLAAEAGEECMDGGCKARLACPVGRDYVYEPDQMQFHMQAFTGI